MSIPFPENSASPDQHAAQAVQAALVAWHHALEIHDWNAVDAGLTAGFLMIEHDRVLDKASLIALVMDSAKRGRQRARLSDFRTEVHLDCAWSTLRNDEVWMPREGAEVPFSFLETAVFRHEDGVWRIDRYHATRLAPPVP